MGHMKASVQDEEEEDFCIDRGGPFAWELIPFEAL